MKSKLRKSLIEKNFVFTAETSPQDSEKAIFFLDQIACLKDLTDAINATDGAGAKSNMHALVTTSIFT